MSVNLTMTDLFAGAGGSSTGATAVPGVGVRVAANHWRRAVEVHNANHPDADHVCADLSQIDPRLFPATDLLWASPECTNHSVAKGRRRETAQPDLFGETLPDEAAERSRATMWDVVRFTEAHRYAAVVVENVVDAYHWAPFRAWLLAMDALGYHHRIVYLNSMHAQATGLPAPQSRDRMYVVFTRHGDPRPDLDAYQRPQAWCGTCGEYVAAMQAWKNPDRPRWGRYRQQYVYRCPRTSCRNAVVEPGWLPAAAAIDWTLRGTRIGDRTRPLAAKTRARIAAGIARYWQPLLIPVEGRDGKTANPAGAPMRAMTTRNETGLALPGHLRASQAVPFIAELRGGGSTARSADHPLATVTAAGNHHALVTPSGGSWNDDARPAGDVLRTMTTREAYALVTPYYGTSTSARPARDPLGTLTTCDRYALIMRNNTARGDQGQMSTPAGEPLRTLTTTGHQSLLAPARTPTAGEAASAEAMVDDCEFRMLEPSEVAAGMAFPTDYRWDGTRRERVRMAGNAVTPPAARDLIAAITEALTGQTTEPADADARYGSRRAA